MSIRIGTARIGTSGWSYDHWTGLFYPEHLPARERLGFYAQHFTTVEIDSTFYRMPSKDTVRHWAQTVGDTFRFSAKGSRFITHYRRLADTDEMVRSMLTRLSPFAEKLAVVLWQLPPTLQIDLTRLDRFLASLPADGPRNAVEFRHESWLTPETFAVLGEHGAAHVHVSSDEMPVELTPTADFVYIRFHGTSTYHGAYEKPALEPWTGFLSEQLEAGRDVYAYFNNDFEGHAPADATRLAEML